MGVSECVEGVLQREEKGGSGCALSEPMPCRQPLLGRPTHLAWGQGGGMQSLGGIIVAEAHAMQ